MKTLKATHTTIYEKKMSVVEWVAILILKKLEPFLNRGRRPFHDWWPFPSFFPASQCVAAF